MASATALSAEFRRRLAANVRRLRTAAGLTAKQAAARAEVHWRHWQKIEAAKNNATMSTIVKMAGALNVTPAELLAPLPPDPA